MSSSLHVGRRIDCAPSTSGSGGACGGAWRAPAVARRPPLLLCRPPTAGAGSSNGSSHGAGAGGQAHRFKHDFRPPVNAPPGAPLGDRGQQRRGGSSDGTNPQQQQQPYSLELGPDDPADPASFWPPSPAFAGAGGAAVGDAVTLRAPGAQRFAARRAPVPVPVSFPGSEYWEVAALQDYGRGWPRLERSPDGNGVRLVCGWLSPLGDPKFMPFFFYRGLEQVRYSWGDRAFQLAYACAYTAAHAAVFSLFWSSAPGLAAALALNWARGRLSFGKWAALLGLAAADRVWLYWLFEAGRWCDGVLARHAPAVRKFCWANFAVWLLYLAFTPAHWHPLPFWPFAPGSFGVHEVAA